MADDGQVPLVWRRIAAGRMVGCPRRITRSFTETLLTRNWRAHLAGAIGTMCGADDEHSWAPRIASKSRAKPGYRSRHVR
jgi:hypothetical protein